MNGVNKTLYIPLYGKSYVSKKGIILNDKNPINDVGVTTVYGIDEPKALEDGTGLRFVREHEMTPAALINELAGMEKSVFKKVYGGAISKKMYRLYEYVNK